MLQNNQLRQVPTEALQNLRSLQSLWVYLINQFATLHEQ